MSRMVMIVRGGGIDADGHAFELPEMETEIDLIDAIRKMAEVMRDMPQVIEIPIETYNRLLPLMRDQIEGPIDIFMQSARQFGKTDALARLMDIQKPLEPPAAVVRYGPHAADPYNRRRR